MDAGELQIQEDPMLIKVAEAAKLDDNYQEMRRTIQRGLTKDEVKKLPV